MSDMADTIVPKSDQLSADALLAGPITIKITRVTIAHGVEQPVSVYFEGDDGKPYKPGLSMRRVMVAVWGPDSASYVGKSMTLFRDGTVTWGGAEVGGIRISHMSHMEKPRQMSLMAAKKARKPFRVLLPRHHHPTAHHHRHTRPRGSHPGRHRFVDPGHRRRTRQRHPRRSAGRSRDRQAHRLATREPARPGPGHRRGGRGCAVEAGECAGGGWVAGAGGGRADVSATCETCQFWEPEEYEDRSTYTDDDPAPLSKRLRLRRCSRVIQWWDATQWDKDGQRVATPEAAEVLAFVNDGSSYRADLLTRPDFGCVMHQPQAATP
jgi:hypothetical protein